MFVIRSEALGVYADVALNTDVGRRTLTFSASQSTALRVLCITVLSSVVSRISEYL